MNIVRSTSNNEDFQNLITQLDQSLWERYNDIQAGAIQNYYDSLNKIETNNTVVLAYSENLPVGCGCFKEYNKSTVEIKRMFVKNEARGKGIAHSILHELEVWAKESGYRKAVLETGFKQAEAIQLYKKCGYSPTENYGPYIGMPNSVCFQKEL